MTKHKLTNMQRSALRNWIDSHWPLMKCRISDAALVASKDLGFGITPGNFKYALDQVNGRIPIVVRRNKVDTNHVTNTTEKVNRSTQNCFDFDTPAKPKLDQVVRFLIETINKFVETFSPDPNADLAVSRLKEIASAIDDVTAWSP
jgi:hypothetical protein